MKQVKIVVVGDSGCGKTSIIKSVTEQSFREDVGLTIGVDHTCIKGIECDLRIWDTAGLERFDSLTTSYYTSSDVIIIVYDVSNCETYEHVLDKWIPKIARLNVPQLIIVGKYNCCVILVKCSCYHIHIIYVACKKRKTVKHYQVTTTDNNSIWPLSCNDVVVVVVIAVVVEVLVIPSSRN